MLSKTFDNGMICASEQAVIVDEEIADSFERIMRQTIATFGGRRLKRFPTLLSIHRHKQSTQMSLFRPNLPLLDCRAERHSCAGSDEDPIARLADVGPDYPLSREKLSPVLALFRRQRSRRRLCNG